MILAVGKSHKLQGTKSVLESSQPCFDKKKNSVENMNSYDIQDNLKTLSTAHRITKSSNSSTVNHWFTLITGLWLHSNIFRCSVSWRVSRKWIDFNGFLTKFEELVPMFYLASLIKSFLTAAFIICMIFELNFKHIQLWMQYYNAHYHSQLSNNKRIDLFRKAWLSGLRAWNLILQIF